MKKIRTDDLKSGPFDTWAVIEAKRAETVKTVQVEIDNKAATRQAIIVALRRQGFTFETRSDWEARPSISSDGPDWNYRGIALHHAGNSFSCDARGVDQIRKAEQIDLKSFGHISYHYAIACDGTVYEALDIREKGAHIAGGNTGVIGIVMLADLSAPGEAYKEEYARKPWFGKMKGIFQWGPDQLDLTTDQPPDLQIKALFALVEVLQRFFPISMLGGHREYQKRSNGEGRACPGVRGMILVNKLRSDYKLEEPK